MKKLDSTVRACQFDVFSIKSSMLLEQKKFIWDIIEGDNLKLSKEVLGTKHQQLVVEHGQGRQLFECGESGSFVQL